MKTFLNSFCFSENIMDSIFNRPLFTDVYERPEQFVPEGGSAYIYGIFEERSRHVELWRNAATDVLFVELNETGAYRAGTNLPEIPTISLRDKTQFSAFFSVIGRKTVYVDFTGLGHHVWAPLIRTALESMRRLRAVYVEPADYHYSTSPRQGEIFDLSERIEGIAPIPLFASLVEPREEEVCFIPLLGFEGTRLAYMIEQVDPPGEKIVPVVGVPGFRAEYPFHAYFGNAPKLTETEAWKNVRYARANCPFSLFYVLEDIFRAYPTEHLKIAPIGTKPHALGAVLQCIASSRSVELVYDHPKRKRGRTSGAFHSLVYSISEFML
jgi:hypothetical protein